MVLLDAAELLQIRSPIHVDAPAAPRGGQRSEVRGQTEQGQEITALMIHQEVKDEL